MEAVGGSSAPLRRRAPRRPLRCLSALAAVAAAGCLAQRAAQGAGFVPSAGAPQQRRGLLTAVVFGAGAGAAGQEARAAKTQEVTEQDLQRIADGYKDLKFLLANWNKETRDCKETMENMQVGLTSGVQSPDNCKAKPGNIKKYVGMGSIKDKLFNTQQLWINIQASDLVSSKDEDRFQEAIEDWEKHKRQTSEWAYSSSWGEANPGGGRDKVEDFLLRSKAEAELALESLGVIVDVLKLG